MGGWGQWKEGNSVVILTLMFQNCAILFLLWNTEGEFLKNVLAVLLHVIESKSVN